MAEYSAKRKAKAVADIIAGKGWVETCNTFTPPISKSTLSSWVNKAKKELNAEPNPNSANTSISSIEGRREAMSAALNKFLLAALNMVDTWATTCSDPEFIKANPHGVHELGRTVLERADLLVSAVAGPAKSVAQHQDNIE